MRSPIQISFTSASRGFLSSILLVIIPFLVALTSRAYATFDLSPKTVLPFSSFLRKAQANGEQLTEQPQLPDRPFVFKCAQVFKYFLAVMHDAVPGTSPPEQGHQVFAVRAAQNILRAV